jgi:hypothetical protein
MQPSRRGVRASPTRCARRALSARTISPGAALARLVACSRRIDSGELDQKVVDDH